MPPFWGEGKQTPPALGPPRVLGRLRVLLCVAFNLEARKSVTVWSVEEVQLQSQTAPEVPSDTLGVPKYALEQVCMRPRQVRRSPK